MVSRRLWPALTMAFTLVAAPPAAAQTAAALVVPGDSAFSERVPAARLPDFRPPPGDLRRAGEPRRNGLIAAYPLGENLQIGVGRFTVPEIARPRTHMETERAPTAARPRDRGMLAVGFSLRF